MKNCIICWNYLYLSQKLAEIDDPVKREEFLKAVVHVSAAAWEHRQPTGGIRFAEFDRHARRPLADGSIFIWRTEGVMISIPANWQNYKPAH